MTMDEEQIERLMQDTAKAAGMDAKKQLATYVRLLPMIVQIMSDIAEHLTQITTALVIANGIKAEADAKKVEADTDGEGGGT